MARVVKPTVTRLQAQKAAAAKKKKRQSILARQRGQAKPLSKEKKRYAPPKKASDQSKASMKRHVIGATRGKVRKIFPEIKTHDALAFQESAGVSKSAALKAPGRRAKRLSEARYLKRKGKTVF